MQNIQQKQNWQIDEHEQTDGFFSIVGPLNLNIDYDGTLKEKLKTDFLSRVITEVLNQHSEDILEMLENYEEMLGGAADEF